MGNRRVLFTSPYRPKETFDFFGYHTRCRVRLSQPRVMCPGLRFIHENVPQIDILEFPTRAEFSHVLSRGWDVVGLSFLTFETNDALHMVDCARKAGVGELWAGSYGAPNPLIESAFDKVFVGYAEADIARELDTGIGELVHPPLIDSFGIAPIGSDLVRTGWLYTARGCPLKCTFCQTPAFAPTVVLTPLESIERVLQYYKQHGVRLVGIYDENFGIAREHSREVVALLRKFDLPWGVMTRSDVLQANFDEWYEGGLVAAVIGIETMNADSLKDVQKALSIEQTVRTMEILNRHGCVIIGTYMIGFEHDTVASVERDLRELRRLRPDFMKVYILTPFLQTPLWDQLERQYGIDCSDWAKFDGKHLVWNHPQLSPEDAQALLEQAYGLFNSEEHVLKFLGKIHGRLLEREGPMGAHSFFFSGIREKLHGGLGWGALFG